MAGPGESGGGLHDLLEGGAQIQIAADVEDRLQEHRQPPDGGIGLSRSGLNRLRLVGPSPAGPDSTVPGIRADALTPPAG